MFSAADPKGHSRLWIADLDLRSSPRQFASSVDEDKPDVDQNGNIYFRAAEGGSNFLYRMKEDGSERTKVLPNTIIEFNDLSPDGRWALVLQASPNKGGFPEMMAAPLSGGAPGTVCHEYCDAMWGNHGKLFAIHFYGMGSGKTLLLQVAPGSVPSLPIGGVDSNTYPETAKGAKVVDNLIVPGPSPGQYAYLSRSVHRNLYRIPLQ